MKLKSSSCLTANVMFKSSSPTSNYKRDIFWIKTSFCEVYNNSLHPVFYLLNERTMTAVPETSPFFCKLCVMRLIANHWRALSSVSSMLPNQSPGKPLFIRELALKYVWYIFILTQSRIFIWFFFNRYLWYDLRTLN